ncbi:hypothetical protein ACJDU8_12205 [Clostridium sp. WILCCON 0269]|uniref:DUF2207 domain-containing protein n=1 Tax=Candidatus Clostridium eludens TaxID=3381663 RepID=A0ABW8SM72_9CLOT
MEKEKKFVGYEYRDVTVIRGMEPLWTDSYASFGWLLEGNSSVPRINSVTLKFKRERKIRNKVELTRLQRQFEGCVKEIENLEKSKNLGASAFAYGIGIVGTAFMALSVFSYLGGMILTSIVVAVPAFAGWVLPYFGYLRIKNKKTEQVNPLIDAQYEKIYDTCEKASRLLES